MHFEQECQNVADNLEMEENTMEEIKATLEKLQTAQGYVEDRKEQWASTKLRVEEILAAVEDIKPEDNKDKSKEIRSRESFLVSSRLFDRLQPALLFLPNDGVGPSYYIPIPCPNPNQVEELCPENKT